MNKNDEHFLVSLIADIVSLSGIDTGNKQVGVYLEKNFWITPSQCYELARIIEEYNNEYYISWEVDRPAVDLLKRASNQNI